MANIIYDLQDLTYLNWSKVRSSSGTAGSFLKAADEHDGKKVYYKLSNYDSINGITGHECVNEIVVDRLLAFLGYEHLEYTLIHAKVLVDGKYHISWVCSSVDYKARGESKVALDVYYDLEREPGESQLEFCCRHGWADYIYRMLIVDYLILNRDRHGANIEVLKNPRNRTVRLAPMFDHGISFFSRIEKDEDLIKEDVMADKPVQCFVGSRSAEKNLELIPGDRRPVLPALTEEDKKTILGGLDGIISQTRQEKMWEMIWKRWNSYADLCDQK